MKTHKCVTVAQVRDELAKLGISFRRTQFGEFRVNFAGGREATAYYTNDLDDALATGRKLAAIREG